MVTHEHGDHNNVDAVPGQHEVVRGAGIHSAKGITFTGIPSFHEMKNIFHYQDINPETQLYGVVGDPVGHSISPFIYNLLLKQLGLNAVYIPFRTAQKVAPARGWNLFVIRARSGELNEALTQSEDVLRRRRNVKFGDPDNFDIKTADNFVKQFDSIFAMIGLVAIAISSLGLLVGGIGVMNIMLVSVTERTQEIGIRKALGARRRDITNQFLFEAMTLTFLGGMLGVILAIGISKLVMFLIPSLPASIPMWAVTAGITVSVGVGLIFGVWPARKAARLDPIECLRYE